jgi:hypothetical protein
MVAAREIRMARDVAGWLEFIFKNLENVFTMEYERGAVSLHYYLVRIARFGIDIESVHAALNQVESGMGSSSQLFCRHDEHVLSSAAACGALGG